MVSSQRKPAHDDLAGEPFIEKEFEWNESGSPVTEIVEAVASVTGQEPTEMEPLADAIDTDSIRQLFVSTDTTPRNSGHVQFQYQGCRVQVSATGEVRVARPGN